MGCLLMKVNAEIKENGWDQNWGVHWVQVMLQFSGSSSFSSLPQSMHSLISLAILIDWITISCNSISQILINSQFLGQLLMRRDEVWSLIIPHAFPKSSIERIIVTYPSKPNLVQHEKAFLAWSLHSSFKVQKRSKFE